MAAQMAAPWRAWEQQGQTLAGSTGIGFQTFLYPEAGGVRQLCQLDRGSEWEGACCRIQGRTWTQLFQNHIEHLLCVSHQARLATMPHSLEGAVFMSEPKAMPCCHIYLFSPRLTLLSTGGIFFLKSKSPRGLLPAPC